MTMIVPLVQTLLAGVFCASAASKLRDPLGATLALRRFSSTENIPGYSGALLGVVEAVLAGLLFGGLFVPALRLVSSLFALASLAVFSVLLFVNLVKGNTFPCNCFGSTHDFTYLTLLRTISLTVGAAWLTRDAEHWAVDVDESVLVALMTVAMVGSVGLSFNVVQAKRTWSRGMPELAPRLEEL